MKRCLVLATFLALIHGLTAEPVIHVRATRSSPAWKTRMAAATIC